MRLTVLSVPLLLAVLIASACSTPSTLHRPPSAVTASLHGDAARPAHAVGWVRSELYFGVGEEANHTPQQQAVDEAHWRAFVDAEVTPRFPDGLTIIDARGQWLFRGNREPNRLPSKILIILHEDTRERRDAIEEIRLAFKQATGQQSVLWAASPVEVAF